MLEKTRWAPVFGNRERSHVGRRHAMVIATATLVASVLGTATSASAHTYTLKPAADTYIRQATPDSNHGTAGNLRIRNTAGGQGEHSFLRFAVPNLAGTIVSATLSLRVTGTIHEVGAYSVSMGNPTWPESWLTWNNWGAGSGFTYLGSQLNLSPGTTMNVDVSSYANGSNLTFGLASGINLSGQQFSSRTGSVAPTLTIVTNGTLNRCDTPESLLVELESLIRTGNLRYACDYKKRLNPSFGAWSGGSENLPVIAAAIALFDGPVVNGTDFRSWFQTFFDHQASTSGSGNVRFFKGSELFSNVYDAATTLGVMAAHFWAHENGHSGVKNRARDYLRRTFYAWSLAASPQWFDSIYRNQGPIRTWVNGRIGSCPTLALASPRSKMWFGRDMRWILGGVLGYSQSCYVSPATDFLFDHFLGGFPGVSGLSGAERTALRALINNTTIPSNLSGVLGGIRLARDYHFLLWADGRRATYYVGHQLNNNIKPSGGKHTVFSAMFDRGTRDLDLLFIEGKNNVSCVDASSRRIIAKGPGVSGCSSSNWMTLPANPTHHFVLGPNGWRSCSSYNC